MGKREDDARYRKSAKGRAKIAAYRKSEAGLVAQARFKASAKTKPAQKSLEKQRVAPAKIPCSACGRRVKREDAAILGRRIGKRWVCDDC